MNYQRAHSCQIFKKQTAQINTDSDYHKVQNKTKTQEMKKTTAVGNHNNKIFSHSDQTKQGSRENSPHFKRTSQYA